MQLSHSSQSELTQLICILPDAYQDQLLTHPNLANLTEIVIDLGVIPEVRFGTSFELLHQLPRVTQQDIDLICTNIGPFNSDNRAGIERTLHRISAIRNRAGLVIGLTCRVGRAIEGTVKPLQDIIESGKNILFLGPPGSGKTTKLREAARILSTTFHKRVIIVDTSNEIAGDGDISHPGIGRARRMQVPSPDRQHAIMIEAVENHMPEVIIVDEIGTEAEALAARTIAERGVQLVATAHGNTIENLLKNPTLSDLLGGIQSVILGDEEAKFRGTQKTILERRSLPTFTCLIEIQNPDTFAVYHDSAKAVDGLLHNGQFSPEIRTQGGDIIPTEVPVQFSPVSDPRIIEDDTLSIFLFGISIETFNQCLHLLNIHVPLAHHVSDATLILTTREYTQSKSKLNQITQSHSIPVHTLKDGSKDQISKFLSNHFNIQPSDEALETDAISEIKRLCRAVKSEQKSKDASPQSAYYRRLQHLVVSQEGLNSTSIGTEPNRRIRIYPERS